MAFKMKSSPITGKLDNFFKGLGNQLKRNRRDIGGKYKGVKQKDKPGGFGSLTDKDKDGMSDFIQAPKKAPKGKETVSTKSKPKTKGPDWKKAPKVGTKARTDWYKKHNLKLDDTTPKYKSKIDAGGPGAFQDDPEKENWGATSRVPLTKKSPYKKGIGKYTKKAKGSRGYKMKK
tara:strand:+ start:559 stop:1083 length:525 start_codon:yes stop_codon:yes gene_type:complete